MIEGQKFITLDAINEITGELGVNKDIEVVEYSGSLHLVVRDTDLINLIRRHQGGPKCEFI